MPVLAKVKIKIKLACNKLQSQKNIKSKKSILGYTLCKSNSGAPKPQLPHIEIILFNEDVRKFTDFKHLFENLMHYESENI